MLFGLLAIARSDVYEYDRRVAPQHTDGGDQVVARFERRVSVDDVDLASGEERLSQCFLAVGCILVAAVGDDLHRVALEQEPDEALDPDAEDVGEKDCEE